MVDLQLMGPGVELHRTHRRARADLGIAFDDGFAVQAHDYAVVGGGVKVDPFRTGREPHAAPDDPVVPGRPALRVNEREIDGRDPLFNDGRVRVAERVVVAADEAGGGGQGERQEADHGQRYRPGEVPGARTPETRAPPAPSSSANRPRHRRTLMASGCRGDPAGATRIPRCPDLVGLPTAAASIGRRGLVRCGLPDRPVAPGGRLKRRHAARRTDRGTPVSCSLSRTGGRGAGPLTFAGRPP